jgi:DNA-binding response OmpR family regulator
VKARVSSSPFLAQPTRLLIVEDSALTASALRLLFQESGYKVDVAPNVEEAVKLGSLHHVDVMLLDLSLPDGDGLLVLKRLRAAGHAPLNTVALTGYDDEELRQRCMDAGCTDVLLKPAPIAKLLALVRSL